MDYAALFDSLPNLFRIFIPGYIFIKTLTYFAVIDSDSFDSFESLSIASVTISYIFGLISDLIQSFFSLSPLIRDIACIALAFSCSIILVTLKTSGHFKKILQRIGKVSGNENIWQDIFDRQKGSRIRCFTKYYDKDVILSGDVQYYEICEDGECSVALVNYKIQPRNQDPAYEPQNFQTPPILYINTRNIHILEVTYGTTD